MTLLYVCAVTLCRYKQDDLPPEAQAVTPLPETTRLHVDTLAGAPAGAPEAQQMGMADFMVLACDGLWDCMTNQQVPESLCCCCWWWLIVGILKPSNLHCALQCYG
jgi:hypothetical protein